MVSKRICIGVWLCSVFSFVALSFVAQGEEQEFLFESVRTLGRGRTFVAAYDSDEASRLNPATLGESGVRYQLRPLEFNGIVGENTVTTINDLTALTSTNDGIGFLRKFSDKFGKRQYLRLQGGILSQRFGRLEISPVVSTASWLELDRPPFPQMQWESDSFAGANISYGYPISPTLAVGATVRPMERFYIAGTLGFMDIFEFLPPAETKFEDIAPIRQGRGYGVDIGTIWKPRPTLRLGLTVQNVGDTGFSGENGKQAPPNIRQVISTGMLLRQSWRRFDFDYSVDIQDLMNRRGVNNLRLLHLGTEFGTKVFSRDHDFGVTVGLNEGYVTAGLFIDLWVMRIDFINYTAELGESPGQKKDKRWGLAARSSITF